MQQAESIFAEERQRVIANANQAIREPELYVDDNGYHPSAPTLFGDH